MELIEVMRTTGSVRSFTDDPIDPSTLHRILDNARFAPSGGNQQGWHVTIVRDPAVRRRLADLSAATWRRYLAEQVAGYRAFSPTDPAPADVEIPDDLPEHPMLAAIEHVPEVLVVTVDLGALAVMDRDLDRCSVIGGASIYPFVHNILLAARNEGLGGVLTTFLAASEPEAGALLGLPEGHAIVAMMGLGRPTHQATRLKRHPVEAFTTIDRVDGAPLTVFPGGRAAVDRSSGLGGDLGAQGGQALGEGGLGDGPELVDELALDGGVVVGDPGDVGQGGLGSHDELSGGGGGPSGQLQGGGQQDVVGHAPPRQALAHGLGSGQDLVEEHHGRGGLGADRRPQHPCGLHPGGCRAG